MSILDFFLIPANKVFTPAASAGKNFIKRERVATSINKELKSLGKQVWVYGEDSAGKSTIIKKILDDNKRKCIFKLCVENDGLENILNFIYHELETTLKTKKQTTVKSKSSGKLGVSKNTSIEVSTEESYTEDISSLVTSKIGGDFQFLFQELQKREKNLLIDDIHKLNKEERTKILDLVKTFSDITEKNTDPKIICVAKEKEAPKFLLDLSLSKKIALIEIPYFTDQELKEIIKKGFGYLHVKLDDVLIDTILNYSNKSASEVHQMCLDICYGEEIERWRLFPKKLNLSAFIHCVDCFVKRNREILNIVFEKPLNKHIINAILFGKKQELSFKELKSKVNKDNNNFSDEEILEQIKELLSDKYRIISEDKGKYKIASMYWERYLKIQINYEKTNKNKLQFPKLMEQDSSQAIIENIFCNVIKN